jgi:uncharacterized protein with ParB-like and HNH nuclease domain
MDEWYSDYASDEEDEFQIDEYDLTASPNDFNVLTIQNFIESGAVKIPGFQRNFVWDIKRASKLIESLILGLPVPQVFLYEESRNKFLVIDGQQRLMSIYYFIKQRFPKKDKRVELRRIFDEERGQIPDQVLHDDTYFGQFSLALAERSPDRPNLFKGLKYSTLGDYKSQFDLRPVRNVIVKQTKPPEDDSAVFEMFNRLNSGGINLTPQEIRGSLYHSTFYDMIQRLNLKEEWRRLLQLPDADIHMKDTEIVLRGFAILIAGASYKPSLTKFLNRFSRAAKEYSTEQIAYLEWLFDAFLEACCDLPEGTFISARTRRFSIALYESVFATACEGALERRDLAILPIEYAAIRTLDADEGFATASERGSSHTANVEIRLERARSILAP